MGFSNDSDSKEFTCNTGDLCSIPGSGRSPGEERGNSFQYSCLKEEPGRLQSIVSHRVRHNWSDLAGRSTTIFLGERMANHSSILAVRTSWTVWEDITLEDEPLQVRRKSTLSIHWKDYCWSWDSNPLATWCKDLTHWKRPWCWERLKAEGEGDGKGWDGLAPWTQWTWI